MNVSEDHLAGALALVTAASAVAGLIVLHALPTGLSPLRQPISHYGLTRFALGYRCLTVSMGLAGAATAAGLLGTFHGRVGTTVILLAVFASARLVISWSPMDHPGKPRTPTGRRHTALAATTFLAITAAAAQLASTLEHVHRWRALLPLLHGVSWWLTLTLVLMGASWRLVDLHRYFGLVQRVFYVAVLSWLGIVGSALLIN